MLIPSIDTNSTRGLAVYFLGFMGAMSVAVMMARAVPERLTSAIKNDFVRSFVRTGVPILLCTCLYHWLFPSAIHFAEHVIDDLLLSILASWVWRLPARASQ
jgi:hypothetical protein